MELALEVKFNQSYASMAENFDQWKWSQICISVVSHPYRSHYPNGLSLYPSFSFSITNSGQFVPGLHGRPQPAEAYWTRCKWKPKSCFQSEWKRFWSVGSVTLVCQRELGQLESCKMYILFPNPWAVVSATLLDGQSVISWRLKASLHVRRKHKRKHKPRVNQDDASTSARKKETRSFFLCLRRPGLHVAYACACVVHVNRSLNCCSLVASWQYPASAAPRRWSLTKRSFSLTSHSWPSWTHLSWTVRWFRCGSREAKTPRKSPTTRRPTTYCARSPPPSSSRPSSGGAAAAGAAHAQWRSRKATSSRATRSFRSGEHG